MLPLLNHSSSISLFEQVYTFFKRAIIEGDIVPGSSIPSVRTLAVDLGISINTVLRAYQQLMEEGYIISQSRSGYYVAEVEPVFIKATRDKKKVQSKKETVRYHVGDAQVDVSNFPMKAWRKMTMLALDTPVPQLEDYEHQSGLKSALIDYLYKARGVKSSSEQLMICSGTTNALLLLHALLYKDYNQIIVESPGYPDVQKIFERLGLDVLHFPVTTHGLDITKLPTKGSYLVYVTPSHQYPTGVIMPVAQRLSLLKWASKTNSYIFEDDYDSEFRYRSKPIPALQALDTHDRVIYLGTFSKLLHPTVRVAYIVLPPALASLGNQYSFLSWNVSFQIQKTLALFFEHGYWERHLRKMRKIYKEKYYYAADAIRSILGTHVSWRPTHAGLYFSLKIKKKTNPATLIQRGAESGLRLYAQKCFLTGSTYLLFGFGGLKQTDVIPVLQRIKKILLSL